VGFQRVFVIRATGIIDSSNKKLLITDAS